MNDLNKIYIVEEYVDGKWHKTFPDTWLGRCYNLQTAKSFAKEYFDKWKKKYGVEKMRCQYLSTKFLIS